ncbi:glutathione S-transferase [Coniella lustricola]|uniref:Glutathione S-transferase n=1 Tax=Coniella lustricola TaxID=2025994 RepID=A0A2T3AAG4_9PEZI|nr:glutathione S-transferase [Coniella lustricola]
MGSESLKPIEVWGKRGPNPPKIIMILEELGVPYKIHDIGFDKIKEPEYLKVNPNGRIPAIQDPNRNDIVIWESGAIIEYVLEVYDTENKISFARGSEEYFHAKQWLFYQVSGQGPYYGQGVWFLKYHPEKVPSATARYHKEVARVHGVLEGHLAKQKGNSSDGPWMVGNKFSFVDLAFYPWQKTAAAILSDTEDFKPDDFPLVKDWVSRVASRPATKVAFE